MACARHGGLVETPPPQPLPVQRHRHQCVGPLGPLDQVAAGARHPAPHGGGEIEPVAIFEMMDEAARHVVVADRGARPPIGRRIGDRLHGQHARAGIVGKRNP